MAVRIDGKGAGGPGEGPGGGGGRKSCPASRDWPWCWWERIPLRRSMSGERRRTAPSAASAAFPTAFRRRPTQQELLELIEKLNRDPAVDGILVQLPLPEPLEADPGDCCHRPG